MMTFEFGVWRGLFGFVRWVVEQARISIKFTTKLELELEFKKQTN